ncbi:MAG: AI-2E family transporter [Armatimonadota bacterium]
MKLFNTKDKSFLNTQHFQTGLFLLVLAVFVWLCILMLKPFTKALGWALALTIIAYPIFALLNRKIKNNSLCALLACVILVGLVVVPAYFILDAAIGESVDLSKNVQVFFTEDNIKNFTHIPENKFTRYVTDFLASKKINIEDTVIEVFKSTSSYIGLKGIIIAKNIAVSVFYMIMAFIITFFLIRDGKRILSYIKAFVPLSDDDTERVFDRIAETIKATIYGWLVIGIVQGILLGFSFWVLGAGSPILWGAVTVLFSFIPLVGTPGIWVPASIILIIKGMYWQGIVLFLWGLLVVSLIDNFLRPILVGKKIHLHILATFFGILGGLMVMGPLGLIMGPVIFAVTLNLLDVFKSKLEEE